MVVQAAQRLIIRTEIASRSAKKNRFLTPGRYRAD
jgi:hypothetical protein